MKAREELTQREYEIIEEISSAVKSLHALGMINACAYGIEVDDILNLYIDDLYGISNQIMAIERGLV